MRPDKDVMDAAIADFLKLLEAEEQELYAGLQSALSRLPVPGKVEPQRWRQVCCRAWIEEARGFTPAEVLLYQHAQDHWYV